MRRAKNNPYPLGSIDHRIEHTKISCGNNGFICINFYLLILNFLSFSKGILPMSVACDHTCVLPREGVKGFQKCCAEKYFSGFVIQGCYDIVITFSWKITRLLLEVLIEMLPTSSDEEQEKIQCFITSICHIWPEARAMYPNCGKFCKACWEHIWQITWYPLFKDVETKEEIEADFFLSNIVERNPVPKAIGKLKEGILSTLKEWETEQDVCCGPSIKKLKKVIYDVVAGKITADSSKKLLEGIRCSSLHCELRFNYKIDFSSSFERDIRMLSVFTSLVKH